MTIKTYWNIPPLEGQPVVTDEQVEAQMEQLNLNFAKVGLNFELMKPIRRIAVSKEAFGAPVNSRRKEIAKTQDKLQKDLQAPLAEFVDPKILKVTVAKPWASFAVKPQDASKRKGWDGVVIVIASAKGKFSGTLTHEVGHWCGLDHTFNGQCNGAGDYVNDTPAHTGTKYVPNPDGSKCKMPITCDREQSQVLAENFMNYAAFGCRKSFTCGQIKRMHSKLVDRGIHISGPVVPECLEAALPAVGTAEPKSPFFTSVLRSIEDSVTRMYQHIRGVF
ncbi:hypothetical protein HGRIS_002920 [Hohenbuehelia grisea]|uniref:Peptidase M43 pregnancy-associated plasma-A domain-containing protein n=2 Tax=Hohenbuehelia grisea TaxID=104357 RepID=A0ABR3JMW4_9AGAR